jgi:hypothetical protein
MNLHLFFLPPPPFFTIIITAVTIKTHCARKSMVQCWAERQSSASSITTGSPADNRPRVSS